MNTNNRKYRIFLSAAEPSADAHCAGLITSLKKLTGQVEFVGVGGAKMAAEGCSLLETTAENGAMLYNAFSRTYYFYKLIRRIRYYLNQTEIDMVVVCDSPAFNFHIAKAAKKAGIKTVFYVAPQLWAWGAWRIGKLRKCCDKLMCLFPFEQDWFRSRGVETAFTGNPLLDEMQKNKPGSKNYSHFDAQHARIALIPGSRNAEIKTLWPAMQKTALRLKKQFKNITFTAAAVNEQTKQILRNSQAQHFRCDYITGSLCEAAVQADFSIVASGSATLQVASAGCPMVIIYQSSRLLWHLLGKWIIKTEYLSLVNILADNELVPEYMPYFSSTKPIADEIAGLLNDTEKLQDTSKKLTAITEPLMRFNASEKAARELITLLE